MYMLKEVVMSVVKTCIGMGSVCSGALRTGTRQELLYLHCILHCLYTLREYLVKMIT